MRLAVWLAVTLIVSGAAGFGIGASSRGVDPRKGPEPDAVDRSDRRSASPVAPRIDLSAPPARAKGTLVELDLADWRDVAKRPINVSDPELWPMLVDGYARDGRLADVLRVARAALAAGVDVSRVEASVALGSPAFVVDCLRTLRSDYPHAAWSEAFLACMLLRSGVDDEGMAIANGIFDRKPIDLDLLRAMVASIGRRGGPSVDARLASIRERLAAARAPTSTFEIVARAVTAATPSAVSASAAFREEAQRLLARDDLAKKEAAAAELAAARAAAAAPEADDDPFYLWQWLAELEQKAGNKGAAFDAWNRAHDAASFEWEPIFRMADLDPKRGLVLVEKRVKEIPDDAGLRLLASTLLRLERGREAAETYFRLPDAGVDAPLDAGIAKLAPEVALAKLTTWTGSKDSGTRARAWRSIAQAEVALGRNSDAVESLSHAYQADDRLGRHVPALIDVTPAAALPLIDAELESGPDETWLALKARALRRLGRIDEAKKAIAAAFELAGEGDDDIAREQVILDPEGAAPRVRKFASERWPRMFQALADAYRELGRFAEARDAYAALLATDPDDIDALVGRCLCR